MGGFSLKLEEAEALLLRWMKQGRKATPLKIIQGLIWQEGYKTGSIKGELILTSPIVLKPGRLPAFGFSFIHH